MSLVLVPVGLVVAALVALWLRRRFELGAARTGDRLMGRKAAKHTALLSRTLIVRADPATVTALVRPVMDDHSRRVLFEQARAADGEAAAWTSTSSVTPALPRMVVRASAVAGWTEFGVIEYAWWFRFPQGGPFVTRVVTPARAALERAGLEVHERRREFAVPVYGPTSDGVRTARPLDPAGPSDGPVSID